MAALPPQDPTRLRNAVEQRLRTRGLLKESADDRWGVTVEVGDGGVVRLSGRVRDVNLQNDTVRTAREVPGVQDVRANIIVPGVDSGQDLVRTRAAIEQRLRSRGLLRESSSDRWGVTVDVGGNGVVTVGGTLRDTALQNEALRIIRETAGVREVRENITIPKRAESP